MYQFSEQSQQLQARLSAFMDEHIYPNEARVAAAVDPNDRWQPNPVIEELKPKAKEAGLWNMFLPDADGGAGLNNLEYSPIAEQLAREAGFHRSWDPSQFMGDGPVRTSIDDSLSTIRSSLNEASDHLVSLALECDRRAEVCAAYARALDRYRRLPFIEQLLVSEPTRPVWWADA